MTTFLLETADGEQLGQVRLGRPNWRTGSVIFCSGHPALRVLASSNATDPEATTILVVEEVAGGKTFRPDPPDTLGA
jgi:hypothetical protein